ncbi:shadow of prion protein 2 [Colossoma macropomum]|uniref:shadow of prion protein 2 n=1 Tax=Colossoma macropomum TaxID=42526 RepID=UPI001863FCDD|nr:shadow of prion protein 2 [Colossoma macropomum]
MPGCQKLPLVFVWMLLVSSLCPWASCKHGGVFGGRGKGVGMGGKSPPTQSKGSSKQGLKLAGAAAAGAIGGAAIGYGLGSLGRPRYGYGYGYDGDSSEEDRRYHYADGPGYYNRSDGRYYRGGSSSGPALNTLLMTGAALSIFLWG